MTAAVAPPDLAITRDAHVPPREQRLAVAAALIAVVFWSSAFVGIRAAGRVLSPGSLSLGRLVVGSLALGILVVARGERLPTRRDLGGVIICGLLWFGAYNVLLNQAERLVDAGTAAMLVNIGPVFIAVLSGMLLGEGFPRRLLIGCAIACAGTVTIGLATSTHGLQAGVGAGLCVAAAAAYAGGVTAEKPLLARNSALTITWLACTVGAIVCLPFAPQLIHELGSADAAPSPGLPTLASYRQRWASASGRMPWPEPAPGAWGRPPTWFHRLPS